MKLIVGLGNPGKKYEKTRHNAGFMALDALARKLSNETISWKMQRKTMCARVTYFDESLIMAKPQTFMNNSGIAVARLAKFYKIKPQDIWVFFDDIDLPLGELRIRERGSSGGHNGANSLIQALGTNDFPRFRLGVGPVPEGIDPADYVLQRCAPAKEKVFQKCADLAASALLFALSNSIPAAMQKFNSLGFGN